MKCACKTSSPRRNKRLSFIIHLETNANWKHTHSTSTWYQPTLLYPREKKNSTFLYAESGSAKVLDCICRCASYSIGSLFVLSHVLVHDDIDVTSRRKRLNIKGFCVGFCVNYGVSHDEHDVCGRCALTLAHSPTSRKMNDDPRRRRRRRRNRFFFFLHFAI